MTRRESAHSPAEGGELSLEFDLPHPPEKVWRALTEPELLEEWLLPVVGFRPELGSVFQFKREPVPGWDGTVHCRIIECDHLRKLSYAWVVGVMDIDTLVTFTLTPTRGGTHLRLVHSGFRPSQKQNRGGAQYGWRMMGERLTRVLAASA